MTITVSIIAVGVVNADVLSLVQHQGALASNACLGEMAMITFATMEQGTNTHFVLEHTISRRGVEGHWEGRVLDTVPPAAFVEALRVGRTRHAEEHAAVFSEINSTEADLVESYTVLKSAGFSFFVRTNPGPVMVPGSIEQIRDSHCCTDAVCADTSSPNCACTQELARQSA